MEIAGFIDEDLYNIGIIDGILGDVTYGSIDVRMGFYWILWDFMGFYGLELLNVNHPTNY